MAKNGVEAEIESGSGRCPSKASRSWRDIENAEMTSYVTAPLWGVKGAPASSDSSQLEAMALGKAGDSGRVLGRLEVTRDPQDTRQLLPNL